MNLILFSFILLLAPISSLRAQMLQTIVAAKPPAAGGNTFTLVQRVMDQSGAPDGPAVTCVAAVCTITVATLGTGHLGILMMVDSSGAGHTLSSVTGGGTWTINPTGAYVTDGCCAEIAGAYTLSTTSSTTVVATWSAGPMALTVDFYEFSVSAGPAIFDTANSLHDATCTSCAGPALTLTGTSDAIVQISGAASARCTAMSSPYNTNFRNTGTLSGDLFTWSSGSYVINSSSGTAPTYTCASQQIVASAMAFK